MNGGGIPEDLWLRVDAVQRDGRISLVPRGLLELRDVAEAARATYHKVEQQLEEDLRMDKLFREQHARFEGHDATQVQKSLRKSMLNYDQLLVAAQDGNTVLLRRLEVLDTDPKFKLLQLERAQLDLLLPGVVASAKRKRGAASEFVVSNLSRYLVELSTLFNERDLMLTAFKDSTFNISAHLSQVALAGNGVASEIQIVLDSSRRSLQTKVQEIQMNLDAQTNLVETIMNENQLFMLARDANRVNQVSSSSDACSITMIEDAIEEIEQLSKHLQEGSDFYKVIVPKLDKLQQQVEEASSDLRIDRCEYERQSLAK
jgi:hypothetical protein